MIIGLGQQKFVGKDTAALYLVTKYGFKRRGFADSLKLEVGIIWRKTILTWAKDHPELRNEFSSWEYGLTVPDPARGGDTGFIWWLINIAKPPFIVSLLQEHGTELRRADDLYYWIKAWARWYDNVTNGIGRHVKAMNAVIPDVRFANEAEFVHGQYGRNILIQRDVDRSSYGEHVSENVLPAKHWNYTINNNGTLEALYHNLDVIMISLDILPVGQ